MIRVHPSEVRRLVDKHLAKQHSTLFGRWNISEPSSRERAAEWLTAQVVAILAGTEDDDDDDGCVDG